MTSDAPPVSRSHSGRRAQLLSEAVRLFREHGYHGTGINDIGRAAGVTGPAIYRHFETKDDLLVSAIIEGGRRLRDTAAEALQSDRDPETALRLLCHSYVQLAVNDPDVIAVLLLEARHLPTSKRAPLRRRARLYAEEYVHLLTLARPHLTDAEASTVVLAGLFMVTSICLGERSLPPERLEQLLTDRMVNMLLA